MNVDVINKTPHAGRLAAVAARGDESKRSMYGVEIADDRDYLEVMCPVQVSREDIEAAVKASPYVTDVPPYESEANRDSDVWEYTDGMKWRRVVADAKTRALAKRLMRRGHFGPFEHSEITFGIEGISRDCMAQMTRHRVGCSFDVQSMRYTDMEDAEIEIPDCAEDIETDRGKVGRRFSAATVMSRAMRRSIEEYKDLRDAGLSIEHARKVLPIGTKVNMTATYTLRALMHVVDMRHAGDAQVEARELAEKMLDLAREEYPHLIEMYEAHAKGSSKKAP